MPTLPVTALPAFSDNYIWLHGDPADGVVVVDPGEFAPLRPLLADGLRVSAILLTHHHADHVGAAGELVEATGAACFAPHDPRIALACERVGDGGTIVAGGHAFGVIALPGHTLSHVAFVGDDIVFCGDTLFSLGCGRLFEGTPTQMLASLDRLAALPGPTRVCCGHEYTEANGRFARTVTPAHAPLLDMLQTVGRKRAEGRPSLPSTIDDERRCNPFLRCGDPDIIAAVTDRLGRPPADRVECFAELRRWKDGFRG